jgi:hypothetical protein
MSFSNKPAANVASEKASTSRYKDAVKLGRAGGGVGHVVGDSQGFVVRSSDLNVSIASLNIEVAAWAQARPRTSGVRLAKYHVHVNTAGLHASAAMGLSGRLEFDSSNHGLC